jgi:hypothetical protein
MEEIGVYCGNIKIADIHVHFLYGDQITQSLTVTVGQAETKKKTFCIVVQTAPL